MEPVVVTKAPIKEDRETFITIETDKTSNSKFTPEPVEEEPQKGKRVRQPKYVYLTFDKS